MDPQDFSTGGRPSPRRELQGPRPAPLKVSKDSHKIKKPPVAPQLHHLNHPAPPHLQPTVDNEYRQPVVIYAVSPKVIHTTVNDFMNLVQRLTGRSPRPGNTPTAAGDLSPAARLASMEKASPSEREKERQQRVGSDFAEDLMEILEGTSFEMGQNPGILSPAPGTLPPVSLPGLFSPAPDPFLNGNNMFLPSPSFLLSSPLISPSIPSYDLFNTFFDF
ncbi:protein MKS1 [Coffea eugenioides]|uniref:protein MKS1 n=1 Tax=Coffea eugenioides TaxID=49369 RepID=UPI000F61228A|nr:protein MKS1 [Coffea eugenioides]